jgi:CBS domain-containing protein
MTEARVRRLPLVDDNGKPAGVLSLDDVAKHTQLGKRSANVELSSEEVVRILNMVYRVELPALTH